MSADLFNELPFNLAGESLNAEHDAQQEANEKRVRELAESEARKAQRDLFNDETVRCPDHRNGGATRCPRGGAALQIPNGVSVEVRDYDVDGIDPERLTETPDGEAAVSVYEGINIWRIMNESKKQ